MSLGENIVRLRTVKGLSQEALADLLGVSRQSVSKWETDVSVPELDKLVKLGEVFGVSLDEIVKGKYITESAVPAAVENPSAAKDRNDCQAEPPVRNGNRAAGLIFLFWGLGLFSILAMLGGASIGLIFALPFLLCGVLCLTLRARRVGLWCGWGLYFLADLYLRYATGLNWGVIFMSLQWSHGQNYMRLFTAWVQFLLVVLLIILTALSCRQKPLTLDAKGKRWFVLGWMGVPLLWFGSGALIQWIMGFAFDEEGMLYHHGWSLLYTLMRAVRDGLMWVLLAALFSAALRAWKTRRSA